MAIVALAVQSAASEASAQYGEDEERPVECHSYHEVSGNIQGQWFAGVRQTRDGPSNGGNVANFTNVDLRVLSSNRRWVWENGGGTYTCHEFKVPILGFWLYAAVLVPPSRGVVIPSSEDVNDAPPPPATGGGSFDDTIRSESDGWCRVNIRYNLQTGEVYWIQVLYCW
jgi:hypothetical protein